MWLNNRDIHKNNNSCGKKPGNGLISVIIGTSFFLLVKASVVSSDIKREKVVR